MKRWIRKILLRFVWNQIKKYLKQYIMKKKNWKDIVSNVCGIVLAVSGSILTAATAGAALPAVLVTYATVGATVSGSVLAWLTGKNVDLTKKTPDQIEKQLNEK